MLGATRRKLTPISGSTASVVALQFPLRFPSVTCSDMLSVFCAGATPSVFVSSLYEPVLIPTFLSDHHGKEVDAEGNSNRGGRLLASWHHHEKRPRMIEKDGRLSLLFSVFENLSQSLFRTLRKMLSLLKRSRHITWYTVSVKHSPDSLPKQISI